MDPQLIFFVKLPGWSEMKLIFLFQLLPVFTEGVK